MRAEIEQIAQNHQEFRRQVSVWLQQHAADQPAFVREEAASYLNQVPSQIQRSLRRSDDPLGRTVPQGLVLRKAVDLRQFLPIRKPRFKAGDRPLSGIDLVVEELIGVGGFGEVYRARYPNRLQAPPVALKVCTDESAAKSLGKEVDLLDRVRSKGKHPGIVELIYPHLNASPPCLEYEYVEGGDLVGFIEELHRTHQATPERIARIMLRLAQAVGFAHRHGIVHRDLKPANILTRRVPNGEVEFKIADFGIGGILSSQEIREWSQDTPHALSETATHRTCTPLYASPQQRRGGPATPRDDVYALGVIWFQMLTGDVTKEPPTGGGWKKRFNERGMSPFLIDLLEKCLDQIAEERPADAQVLADRLGSITRTESAGAGRDQEKPQQPTTQKVRIVGAGSWSEEAAKKYKVYFDGAYVGEGDVWHGINLGVTTTIGTHTLELATIENVSTSIWSRNDQPVKKAYKVRFTEQRDYEIRIDYLDKGMTFITVDVVPIDERNQARLSDKSALPQELKSPTISLLVVSVAAIMLSLLSLMSSNHWKLGIPLLHLLSLVQNGFVVFSAIQTWLFKSHKTAILGSSLAMGSWLWLTGVCIVMDLGMGQGLEVCLLGLFGGVGCGIWSLVVLLQPNIRGLFASPSSATPNANAVAQSTLPQVAKAPFAPDAIPLPPSASVTDPHDLWYYAQEGKKTGPFTIDQMKECARRGVLQATAMVLRHGSTQWVPAYSEREFGFPPHSLHASHTPVPSGRWYYAKQGKTCGPISVEEIRRLLQSRQLLPADLVCKEGTQTWVAANTVRELNS